MKKSLIVLIGVYLLLFEINIFAQSYPTRPVKIIVPYPPGGATDIAARLIAGSLTEAFGQAFTVENRPGAGGMIALDQVASAAPDGYTLLVASTGPKISSWAIIYSGFTSPSIVGATKKPLVIPSGIVSPPANKVAPSSIPFLI